MRLLCPLWSSENPREQAHYMQALRKAAQRDEDLAADLTRLRRAAADTHAGYDTWLASLRQARRDGTGPAVAAAVVRTPAQRIQRLAARDTD